MGDAGPQWQPAGPIDDLAYCGQQSIGVVAGTAGRTTNEQDLSAVHIGIGVKEGNVVRGRRLLDIAKHFINGCCQRLAPSSARTVSAPSNRRKAAATVRCSGSRVGWER